MTPRQLIFSFMILLVTPSMAFAEAQCPGNAQAVRYHSFERSQISIAVKLNGVGPYEFMVDTGSQFTIIDPLLAAELGLKPLGTIGMVAVSTYSHVSIAQLDSLEVNFHLVAKPLIAIQDMGQIQAGSPDVRGILGVNFLGRFDLLIDYGHKMLCLDETKAMQQSLMGEHIPLVAQVIRQSDLPFTQPLLISVHLRGNGSRETILNLDSGAGVPLLFAGQSEAPSWLADRRQLQGSGAGGAKLSFSVLPPQDIRLGKRSLSQVTFVTPVTAGHAPANVQEDGLLPTSLFKRVLISYADHFVVFDPR